MMKAAKYLILISGGNHLGGAQIRYLNLFSELEKRNSGYRLIINRKLFDIGLKAQLISESPNIDILEVDEYHQEATVKFNPSIKHDKKRSKLRLTLGQAKSHLKQWILLFKLFLSINKVFKKNKPSSVYGIWMGGMLMPVFKLFYSFRFVYSFMDSGFSSMGSFAKSPLQSERLPLRFADAIDFLSDSLATGITQYISIPDRVEQCVSPCSFKDFDKLHVKAKKNHVLFCSRLTAIKNPLLFLEAVRLFNMTYNKADEIVFKVLGDGPYFEPMREYINEFALANVEMLGFVPDPGVFFAESKVFVSIQQENNYPSQSVLEAMACQNVVVASDVGETRRLVTEEEGKLVALDAKAISDALISLFDSEENIASYASKSREKVISEHSIDRFINYFYSLENVK